MSKPLSIVFGVCAILLAGGCGKSAQDVASPAVDNTPRDPIARVVYEFLDAVRRGDTSAASSRLTPLALQRTNELDMNISPPGSRTAKFEIGATELIDNDKAIVESIWSDQDADGQLSKEQITWALKLTEGAWRISGMAAEIGPNQPPVVIDFENPEPLTAPANLAGGEGEESGVRQARQPAEDPFRQ